IDGGAGCISREPFRDCARGRGLGSISDLVISPDGKSVYVSGADSLTSFDRSPSTGRLTQKGGDAGCFTDVPGNRRCRPANFGPGASRAVTPDGRNMYMSMLYPGGLLSFSRSTPVMRAQLADSAPTFDAPLTPPPIKERFTLLPCPAKPVSNIDHEGCAE